MSVAIGPGARFAGYRVEELVGRGGMGVVYRATDLSLERPVALKLIAPELAQDERFRARFLREPRLAAALDHPSAVPIYEAGECEGQLYLAMRYVEGSDLRTLLRRQAERSAERALTILAQIADALDAAHRRGLVHRDVKPANVLLDDDGHAYLTDFGISKQLGDASTDTGRMVGTLDYLAPEQIRGERVDGRTDCYALACVLYECLAGAPPFRRQTEAETLWAHMQDEPAPLAGQPALDPVLQKGLAKEREQRYASCGELIAAARAASATGSVQRAAPATPAGARPKPRPGSRRRKIVTVLFCDLSASTGDFDPESLERLISRRLEEMRSVLERHGGAVERLASDAVVAVFGVPRTHEDDPLRAVRAAAELRERLATPGDDVGRREGFQVPLRMGIGTGLVVTGQSSQGEPLVTGVVVNLAARLAQSARTGEILLADQTWRLVKDAAGAEPAASDGEGEAPAAFRLLEVLPARPRRVVRLESPMFGRRRELGLLSEALERVVHERACHLFTLLGAAGVGKSRLVDELVRDLADKAAVVHGRCLPYGDGITFWPIAELVKEAAKLSDDDSVESARGKVRSLVEREKDADLLAERILEVIGLAGATTEKEVSFWAIRRLCEALARERPLVAVLDDIQWGEGTFLELVEHIADWSSDAPILLLCVARPELVETRPDWGGGKLNATSVMLEPLVRSDCEHLIESLLGRASLAESARGQIAEAAGGNPLFAEELVAMLVETGFLRRTNGSWAPVGELSLAPIPATIQALLVARLDRLDPDERALIERAAIEGEVFHRGAVTELSAGVLEADLGRCLMGLTRKELIRRDRPSFADEEAFRFRHLLVRDAAYESLPRETRAELHERFATWLEQKAGQRASEHDEILGYHLEQAYRSRNALGPVDQSAPSLAARAARHLGAAGRRALARSDLGAAASLLERALALAADEPWRLELRVDLAIALGERGEFDRADELLGRVIEAAEARGERRLRFHALVERSYRKFFAGSPAGRPTQLAREAVQAFEEIGDELGLARAWMLLGLVDKESCHARAAAASFERALLHARRAGAHREEEESLHYVAHAHAHGPTPADEAIARCERLLAEASGRRRFEANVMDYVSWLKAMQGRFEEARALYSRGQAIFADLGLEVMAAGGTQTGGLIEMLAGDPAAAERELRRGYDTLERFGEKWWLSTNAVFLAQALDAQGKQSEAERFVQIAAAAAAADDLAVQVSIRAMRARLLARRAEPAEAEQVARQALELAASMDFVLYKTDARLALADVLLAAGRKEEAIAEIEAALALHLAKGDVASAERARKHLRGLGSGIRPTSSR